MNDWTPRMTFAIKGTHYRVTVEIDVGFTPLDAKYLEVDSKAIQEDIESMFLRRDDLIARIDSDQGRKHLAIT